MTRATPLLDDVRAFAVPRCAGGPGERRIADEMARRFTDAGLAVTTEPFRACRDVVPRMRRRLHFAVAAALLLQGVLGIVAPLGALVVGVLVLGFAKGAGRWELRMESEFDREPAVESRNVTGRRPAPGANPVTLVFLAHLDSKSTRLSTATSLGLVFGALAVGLALTVWGAAAHVAESGGGPPAVLLPAAFAAAGALVIAQHNPAGNASPGALDNASGLAVLADVARTLPADPKLASVELVFVATGAEEIGLAGAMRWIRRHGAALDPARTVFVNVDSVGVGRGLLLVDVRGRAPDGRRLATVAREAARAVGVRARALPLVPGIGVDTMPIGARGFSTVTLVGGEAAGVGRRIHTAQDLAEPLREEALAAASAVVAGIARSLAERA